MKRMITLILVIPMFFFSCLKREYYLSDQIKILTTNKNDNSTLIEYTVPLETLYFSSGCVTLYNRDTTKVTLRFIRQKNNSKFYGDLKSELVSDKNKIYYLIQLPKSIKRINIITPQQNIYLYPPTPPTGARI